MRGEWHLLFGDHGERLSRHLLAVAGGVLAVPAEAQNLEIQRVTTPETGSLLKPYVNRLSDGTLLLAGSRKLDQNRRQLLIATLAGDAPAYHQPPLATGEGRCSPVRRFGS